MEDIYIVDCKYDVVPILSNLLRLRYNRMPLMNEQRYPILIEYFIVPFIAIYRHCRPVSIQLLKSYNVELLAILQRLLYIGEAICRIPIDDL